MRTTGRSKSNWILGLAMLFAALGLPAFSAGGGASLTGTLAAAAAPVVTPLRAYRDGYSAPSAIATDSMGRVYITDHNLGKVFVRDEFGRMVSVKSGLDHPLGIAVDASGRIYVGEAGSGSVSVFLPDWSPSSQLGQGAGGFSSPMPSRAPSR